MKSHRVVVLGNSGVGKTSLIAKCVDSNAVVAEEPTIGVDFSSVQGKIGEETVRIQFWDTAGQEQFQSLIPQYLRGATIALLVYSVDSQDSFDRLDHWLHLLQQKADPKLIIVGNKTDLAERVVSADAARKYAAAHKADLVETSALENTNVDKLMDLIKSTPPA